MSSVMETQIIEQETRKITKFECLAVHISQLDTEAWLVSCFRDWDYCHDHGIDLIIREIVESFRFEGMESIGIWSDYEVGLHKMPRTVYVAQEHLFVCELVKHYPTNSKTIEFFKGNPAPEV